MPARPLQPCPACAPVLCCSDNPFAYSLVNGPVYENDQVAINFECPPGFNCIPGTYVIPAGRIRFIPTNGSTLRLQCCQSEIVRPVPAGATQAQIGVIAQSMVNACALQAAQCAGAATVNQGTSFNHGFRSNEQCYNQCANTGRLMGWITPAQPALPAGVFFRDGFLCVRPATFTSNLSQSDADTRAFAFIRDYAIAQIFEGTWDCGYWNTEQECPDTDPVVLIPAFTFFSTVSQAAADQLALDSCVTCPEAAMDPANFVWVDGGTFCDCAACAGSSGGAGGFVTAEVSGSCNFEQVITQALVSAFSYNGPAVTLQFEINVLSIVTGPFATASIQVFGTGINETYTTAGIRTVSVEVPDSCVTPTDVTFSVFATGSSGAPVQQVVASCEVTITRTAPPP